MSTFQRTEMNFKMITFFACNLIDRQNESSLVCEVISLLQICIAELNYISYAHQMDWLSRVSLCVKKERRVEREREKRREEREREHNFKYFLSIVDDNIFLLPMSLIYC